MITRAIALLAASFGLAAVEVLLAVPAQADVLGQPCSTPSLISNNTADSAHEMIVCAGHQWGQMPDVQAIGSHATGSSCDLPDGVTALGYDPQGAWLVMCYQGAWTHYRS
jgi:hypothetical protein